MTTRTCIFLGVLLCTLEAAAAEMVFNDVCWPRHNKTSGLPEWELRAATAKFNRDLPDEGYWCRQVEIRTFKLLEENRRQVLKTDSFLRGDEGRYYHDPDKPRANLAGNVVAESYGQQPVRVTTDKADITWSQDETVRTRRVVTESKVTLYSPGRTLVGEGFEAEERVNDTNPADSRSLLKMKRNVVMVIEGTADAALPVIAGNTSTPGSADAEPPQTTITCLKTFVFDRGRNWATFEDNVLMTRADTRMRCDKLKLTFAAQDAETRPAGEKEAAGKKTEGKGPEPRAAEAAKPGDSAGMKLSRMIADKNVTMQGKDQQFSGDWFDWDPGAAVGKLTGSPARMLAQGLRGAAALIEFDQKNNRITYTGGAEVEIELKKE